MNCFIRIVTIVFGIYFFLGCSPVKQPLPYEKSNIQIEIIEYGIFEFESVKTVRTSNYIAGEVSSVRGATLIQKTNRIPIKKDVSFGIKFYVSGFPENREIEVKRIFKMPELIEPKSGIGQDTHVTYFNLTNNEEAYTGFSLNNDWEMVPGIWEVQLFYKDMLLKSKNFTVY